VESLVGVVPGGGGVKEMLYRWYERTGDIPGLERKAFVTLAKTDESRARIEFMLKHGTPLRN